MQARFSLGLTHKGEENSYDSGCKGLRASPPLQVWLPGLGASQGWRSKGCLVPLVTVGRGSQAASGEAAARAAPSPWEQLLAGLPVLGPT